MLDYFALLVLIVLLVSLIAGAVLLAAMPGRIARQRNHPQAEAIAVCGWWGLLTLGILLPLAYVWAYWRPGPGDLSSHCSADPTSTREKSA